MIYSGLLSAVGLVVVAAKFSPEFLRKILGYSWMVDLIITIIVPVFMGGTQSGIMTGIVMGLAVSLILTFCTKCMGYSKYELDADTDTRHWVYHSPAWTLSTLGSALFSALNPSLGDISASIRDGWRSEAAVRRSAAIGA